MDIIEMTRVYIYGDIFIDLAMRKRYFVLEDMMYQLEWAWCLTLLSMQKFCWKRLVTLLWYVLLFEKFAFMIHNEIVINIATGFVTNVMQYGVNMSQNLYGILTFAVQSLG